MNANGATAGLSIDIWNEPDLTYFWNAPQSQYLQMWGRTYHRLRLVISLEMNLLGFLAEYACQTLGQNGQA